MKIAGDLAFIGLSKLRKGNSLFNNAPIAKEELFCGVVIVHIPSGKQMAWLRYENSAEELYDVNLLSKQLRPNILNTEKNIQNMSVVTQKEVFWVQEQSGEQLPK